MGSHCGIFIFVSDLENKPRDGKERKEASEGTDKDKIEIGDELGGERAGWFFFAEHRHSQCIISSFKSTYTICSCRLLDILVYVHSSEKTHAKSIVMRKEGWVNV